MSIDLIVILFSLRSLMIQLLMFYFVLDIERSRCTLYSAVIQSQWCISIQMDQQKVERRLFCYLHDHSRYQMGHCHVPECRLFKSGSQSRIYCYMLGFAGRRMLYWRCMCFIIRLSNSTSSIQVKGSIEDGKMDTGLPQLLQQQIKLHSFLVHTRRNQQMWHKKLSAHLLFQFPTWRFI